MDQPLFRRRIALQTTERMAALIDKHATIRNMTASGWLRSVIADAIEAEGDCLERAASSRLKHHAVEHTETEAA